MKIFLQRKKVFFVCSNGWEKGAPEDIKANYLVAKNEAISYMVARMSKQCFNKVFKTSTIDSKNHSGPRSQISMFLIPFSTKAVYS